MTWRHPACFVLPPPIREGRPLCVVVEGVGPGQVVVGSPARVLRSADPHLMLLDD